MTITKPRPISSNWTTSHRTDKTATAAEVNEVLAQHDVADIAGDLVPYLAAAAAELALLAEIPWRFSVDDPAVTFLRLIAKVAIAKPNTGSEHTSRLRDVMLEHGSPRSTRPRFTPEVGAVLER